MVSHRSVSHSGSAYSLDWVARELLDPDHLHFIVVGKPEGLESGAGN